MKRVTQLVFLLLLTSPAFSQTVSTPNVGLQVPTAGSTNWNLPLNFNFNLLDQILGGTIQVPGLGLQLKPAYGIGAPILACTVNNEAQGYYDVSNVPYQEYSCHNLSWSTVGGAGGGGGGSFPTGIVFGITTISARAAVPADIASLLSSLSGCTTVNNLYAPANGNCIPGGGGGGSSAFSAILAGTNNTAAMVVGSGASIALSGTGTVQASAAPWAGLTGTPPTFNQDTTGNAGSANALAATPNTCTGGQVPIGVDIGGNAIGCFNPSGSVSGTIGFYGKFASGTALGTGTIDYGVTTAATNTSSVPFQINDGSGQGGTFTSNAGSSPSGVSAKSKIYMSSTTNQFMVNMNAFGESYLVTLAAAATPGNCVMFDTDGIRIKDAGAVCGTGGGAGGTPTFIADAGAGTGPTVSFVSGANDSRGWINVTTGTSPTASAGVVTIKYGNTYSTIRKCSVAGSNTPAAILSGSASVWVPQASSTTALFVLFVGSTGLSGSTAYQFFYECGT